ncbi:Golgi apparatus membrane protein TVP38 [Hypsizygus marmoreus]|uniref:Golgi apparatus membrane protein TVP38 n=1 Tax=Hypsizygus marmoreus TaxID=39966 RepID=A0A369JPH6_HYPMA|nr:Golgi apparatus membrane protein TVP38 [Hypsizygus marmoreus]
MAAKGIRSPVPFIKRYAGIAFRRYTALHIMGKIFIWLVILFYICAGVFVVIVTPSRIAQYLYDHARMLAETWFGWLALAGAIVLMSFPPLIGHTTLVTLCGFAYGMKGFCIASSASVAGASLVFVVLRLLFSGRLRQWSSHNDKWQALESVVRAKGLPLIILIRISPFPPWVYSNSLFASIEAVALWQFVTATLFVLPKLLLHVFIGSRIAALSDGDQRGHMDTQTKLINGLLIAGGIVLVVFTSWSVYNMVQKHIRHLEGIPPEVDELAAEAIEDYGEEEPLLLAASPRASLERV